MMRELCPGKEGVLPIFDTSLRKRTAQSSKKFYSFLHSVVMTNGGTENVLGREAR